MQLPYPKAILRLRSIHKNMQQRCNNPLHEAYHSYGGRGITIATELAHWTQFIAYASTLDGFDDSEKSLDRKDNNLGYCIGNLRFATRKEQAANRRNAHAPDIAAMSAQRLVIEAEGAGKGGVTYFVVRCTDCGHVFKRKRRDLIPPIRGCRTCARRCLQAEQPVTQSQATIQNTKQANTQYRLLTPLSITVGYRSGDWEVLDVTNVKRMDDGVIKLKCRCAACGNEQWQARGKLLRQTATNCAVCYNRKQHEKAVARKVKKAVDQANATLIDKTIPLDGLAP